MTKVSIITVCYNSAQTIEDTIKSVIGQDYADKEYIIIDGASTDQSLEIIGRYRNQIQQFVSEKDKGLYDALNKGISLATGDVIAILHADDFYPDSTILSTVVREFESKKVDSVYGDLQYVDRLNTDKLVRNWISGEFKKSNFLRGWMPPHPAFFVRKQCYTQLGKFNLELRSAADYEIMLRFLYRFGCSTSYLPKVLVKMRVGGKSNKSIWNRIKANREDKRAWEINGLKPNWNTFIMKPLSKISQFF